MTKKTSIIKKDDFWNGQFKAMASTCQVLIDQCSQNAAQEIVDVCYAETKRIERKFSRYLDNNIVYRINHSQNQKIPIDKETYNLLQFADTCFHLSEGMFDITAGVLNQIWKFDESSQIPNEQKISDLLKLVGWEKIDLSAEHIRLPEKMQIDLGGIGKEYAVDRCATLITELSNKISFAINYGGDIYVNKLRQNKKAWKIGIEAPNPSNPQNIRNIHLENGGIATSGNTKRFFMVKGKRFGHILNPKTGRPVENAPLSVTVIAENCTQAGMLATFAMLNGGNAENFLETQGVKHWIYR